MKYFYIILFLCFCLTFTEVSGQKSNRKYKNFSDTTFNIGDKILAQVIYFELEGWGIVRAESYDSLKVIADFLNRNPNIIIEIGFHTDTRGNEAHLVKISDFYATRVKEELIDTFNVNPNRIFLKGYGKSDLIIPDEEIQKANPDEIENLHRINRRIEIKIIKK